jgi:acyl carrier protein
MSDTEARIRSFIETKFRPQTSVPSFDRDTPLFSSGIVDSFGVLELISFLEDAFKIDLDPSQHDIEEFDTVAKTLALVTALQSGSPKD